LSLVILMRVKEPSLLQLGPALAVVLMVYIGCSVEAIIVLQVKIMAIPKVILSFISINTFARAKSRLQKGCTGTGTTHTEIKATLLLRRYPSSTPLVLNSQE
jgi:hypothetical protein